MPARPPPPTSSRRVSSVPRDQSRSRAGRIGRSRHRRTGAAGAGNGPRSPAERALTSRSGRIPTRPGSRWSFFGRRPGPLRERLGETRHPPCRGEILVRERARLIHGALHGRRRGRLGGGARTVDRRERRGVLRALDAGRRRGQLGRGSCGRSGEAREGHGDRASPVKCRPCAPPGRVSPGRAAPRASGSCPWRREAAGWGGSTCATGASPPSARGHLGGVRRGDPAPTGDRLALIVNGRLQVITISGVVLSPEHVYAIPPGGLIPRSRRRRRRARRLGPDGSRRPGAPGGRPRPD